MKRLKIGDICLLVAIPTLAVVLWLWLFFVWNPPHASRPSIAVLRMNGEVICTLPLDKNTAYITPTGHEILIKDGKAFVNTSPCQDHICTHSPPISSVGQSLVCLPYRLVLSIEEGER